MGFIYLYSIEYYHLRDDELTIEGHVHGVPRPVVTWWRGAFQVKPSYKFTMLEEAHGVCKLLIYKPGNKDSGTYTLKAINSIGEAQINQLVEVAKNLHYHVPGIFHARDRIQLDSLKQAKVAMDAALKSKAESDQKRAEIEAEQQRVQAARAPPEPLIPAKQKLQFATQLRDRMALEGTTVKFAATVIGPDPNTRWMKDDKWLVMSENIKNLSEEGKAIIQINNVTSADSGVYKCVAKNDQSEIETSCYFKVYAAQADGDESEPIFALPLRGIFTLQSLYICFGICICSCIYESYVFLHLHLHPLRFVLSSSFFCYNANTSISQNSKLIVFQRSQFSIEVDRV